MRHIPYWQEYFGRVRLTPYKTLFAVLSLLLVFACLVLAIVIYGIRSAENEKKWIETADPRLEAEKDFQRNDISFLQIWIERGSTEEDEPQGVWITPCEREKRIFKLGGYPSRKIELSTQWDDNLRPFNAKAMVFATKYNERMLELVSSGKTAGNNSFK